MESEAKIILAFLFNRSGKPLLSEAELYLPLSMELGWFSAKEAQEFLAHALTQKLLIKEGKLLRPNFPVDQITIPVGFTPSKKALKEKGETRTESSLIDAIITAVSEHTKHDRIDIEDDIRREATEKNILPEVAALAVAWRHGVDITPWLDAVEPRLLTENTG
jgi:hypothetical protein